MVVCFFAFAGLLSIWYHLGRKKGDAGQVYLALSILCWSISGAVELYYARGMTLLTETQSLQLSGWRSILSLLNSLLILLSLPWFRYQPAWMAPLLKSKYWMLVVGLPFLFSLLPTLSKMMSGKALNFVSEPDVYYAVMTLVILGNVLWESFTKRGLHLLAYLSIVFLLVTLSAQLYKVTSDLTNLVLLSAIFKTLLIMIFFALALSWVKDLSEVIQPDLAAMSLSLTREKVAPGRFEHLAHLSGVNGHAPREVRLSPTLYNLLLLFVETRIKDPGEGWLEIKPKGSGPRSKSYDINDYNEIKRLIQALLDGLYGKELWSKERHETPLKEALFEFNREEVRKIRLRLPAEKLKVGV